MRTPTRAQSYFRYPLNRVLASEGAVRIIRELARHGRERSVPALARATKLSAQAIRNVLTDLTTIGIVEAIGQSASILFSKTTGTGTRPGEFLVLGSINNMRFLAPVVPGDRMEMELRVLKFIEDLALVEAVATVLYRCAAHRHRPTVSTWLVLIQFTNGRIPEDL